MFPFSATGAAESAAPRDDQKRMRLQQDKAEDGFYPNTSGRFGEVPNLEDFLLPISKQT